MSRYYVCRQYIKWRGHWYKKGDLLPPTFTHHDKARSIYNSRIAKCSEKQSAPESDLEQTPGSSEELQEGLLKEDSRVDEPIVKPPTKVTPAGGMKSFDFTPHTGTQK